MNENGWQKVILGAMGVWGIFLAIVGFMAWQTSRQTIAMAPGSLVQRAAEQTLFLGDGQTTVTIIHAPQTDITCNPQTQQTSIVLLLDKSGSMGPPDGPINVFDDAITAAQAFIREVDLGKSQVAVAFFDFNVFWTDQNNPFSNDLNTLLAALEGINYGGGTDVALALEDAGEKLLTHSQSSQPVIVLLSDGGQDFYDARRAATRLKNQNIRIITIALGIQDSGQQDFLQGIASKPQDAYQAVPDQLAALYTDIATGINTAVATNVVVEEKVSPDLTIVGNSSNPAAQQQNNLLRWDLPSMDNTGASFSYQVATSGAGLYSLTEGETKMSYTHCVTGATEYGLPTGPDLMVLPAPLWTGLCGLLPFFVFFFVLFWWRKKETPPTSDPTPPPPPPPVREYVPAWLTNLTTRNILVTQTGRAVKPDLFTPTLIIGLGEPGRVVLNQIAQQLRSQYGEQLPAPIRLLQIDIDPQKPSKLQKPPSLKQEEWVLLKPDIAQMQQTLAKNPPQDSYLDWYDPFNPSGRMNGRLAIFADLYNGTTNSELWRSLEKQVYKLGKPKIKVVGSTFDDSSSGLLVDVVRLAQLVLTGVDQTYGNPDVEMWLTAPVNTAWPNRLMGQGAIPRSEQETRTKATLRELERFQRNVQQPFEYVDNSSNQAHLRSTTNSAVVQTIFLFEPRNNKQTVDDHLTTIADGLLATLYTSSYQEFSRHISQTLSEAGKAANVRNVGTICSLGIFAIRTPIALLEQASAWRLVTDLLFEQLRGVYPTQTLLYPQGNYQDTTTFEARNNYRSLTQKIMIDFADHFNSVGFVTEVRNNVNKILNGEMNPDLNAVEQRVGGIAVAKLWLSSLQAQLRPLGESKAASKLQPLMQELEKWETFLKDEVQPVLATKWQATRSELAQLRQQQQRLWLITDELEWPFYQNHIRPTVGDGAILERASQRCGWYLNYNERTSAWKLEFLLPPLNYEWHERGKDDLPEFEVKPEIELFLQAMFQLALPLVQSNSRGELITQLPFSAQEWLEKAKPGVVAGFQQEAKIKAAELPLLVAPENAFTQHMLAELQNSKTTTKFCAVEAEQHELSLMIVQGHMELPTYRLYNEEAWYDPPDASMYVWRGERQAAASGEPAGAERFNAQFVSWLQLNQPLLRAFCEALIYEVLEQRGHQWFLPGLGVWPSPDRSAPEFIDALKFLMGHDTPNLPQPLQSTNPHVRRQALQELRQAVDEQKEKRKSEFYAIRNDWLKNHLPAFNQAQNPLLKHLGVYMASLLQQ